MKHYICKGSCHGESPKPVNCGAESCEKHDQPLTECNCEDGKHGMEKESSSW